MKIGAHVSIAGSIDKAPLNAHKAGCECFQFFSRSPQGGKAPILTPGIIKKFKAACKKYKFTSYIHTPYYINLASNNNRIRYGSISVIREDLERASLLGAKYVMTHLGSAKDFSQKEAIDLVIKGIKKILEGYKGSTQFLIEMSAGAGEIVGDTFKEIATIIKEVGNQSIGVCFDTCHAFASGYDLRSKKTIDQTLQKFNQTIGLAKLKLIHINDSASDLGSHIDRHEHIGMGKIGKEGIKAFINHPRLKKLDAILETPNDGKQNDIKVLKSLRGS